jgi:MYXO-CTERM domain-containing protein
METAMNLRVLLTPRTVLLATLASAGPLTASAASGQIGYEARTRFALGHGANPIPLTSDIVIAEPGRIDLTLQMGIFDAQGFVNYGIGFWSGSIFSSEPTLTRPSTPRVAPFNGAFGYDGNLNAERTRIGLAGERPVEPTRGDAIYHYEAGEPVPNAPRPVGAEEFANLYRFSLVIEDLETPRDITIRAEGNNWPIEGFFTVQHTPPEPDSGETGFVWYSPNPAGHGPAPARPTHLSMLTISVVPSPTGAATLALLGALAVRRRRRAS